MSIPYTYLLKHIPSNTFYYGVRFAKNCHPKEFWVSYKTSSKHVAKLIEEYGESSFEYQIRKTFSCPNAARRWESKVLKRMHVINRTDFINRCDGKAVSHEDASRGRMNRVPSDRLREVYSKIGKSNLGKKHTEETKEKVRQSMIGNTHKLNKKETDETRLKKRNAKLGKLSNVVGNHQSCCSCLICHKEVISSSIKSHFNFHHK